MATVVLDHGSSGGMAKQDLDFGVRFDKYYIEMNHRSGSSDLFKVLAFGKAHVSDNLKRLDDPKLSLEQKMELLQTELHKYGIKLDRGEASNWLVYFIAINERYGTSLSQIAANFIGYVNEDRNNLTRELRNLPLGVFGRLEHFVQNNELIKLANNISLQINKDSAGYYISINNQKHYITTKGSLIYKKNGKIIIEAIEDKSKLGERYEQLKKEGIGEIYYIYSGDLVSKKNGEITREKGIRVERLVSEPNGNVVYHGRILFQTTDVMVDNQHRRLEILFVRTDTGIRSYYRIVDPSQNYLDRYEPSWMPLNQETLNNPNSLFSRARDVAGNRIKSTEYLKGVYGLYLGGRIGILEHSVDRSHLPGYSVFFMNYMVLPAQIPETREPERIEIPEQTRQTITEYKVSLETPRTVFLNSNPNISERDNRFEIRIQFNQSLIEDMEWIVIRIGNFSMRISRDQMKINENGELVLGISTGFLGFNLGTQTVMVAVYGKEGEVLARTAGTTTFLLDRTNITSPKSMYTNRTISVVASYNITPGAAREIESHELGVVGTAQGKDGKWYLFFAENTSVNREPVSGYRVFDTKEELEKFLRENEIITQTQNIKRGGITFNLNFEIPTGLEIDRTEFRMLGQVRVDGITREVNVGSITDLRYLPRSEPITGEGTDESEMKKPPEQQPQTLEPPKEQQIQREIQIAIDAPTSVVEGSEEPIPVQVKIENATTASIFLVDKQDNIVLPDGRVIGKLEDFIDEITGLLDLDKLSAELSKHPQARVSADGQLLLNNRGEGFTVHVLAINDDEKKLMRQEIGTVEISANIDVQNGSIRNGIVEKPVEVTLKLEPPGVTGFDPLKQVTIDGKSLEELQRQGLVEVDYDSKTQEVKITLTDRGMIELGGDGKVEVRLYGRYGVEGAHGTTELRLQKDASVEVRRTETEIVAPSVYTIEHKNGVLTLGRFINVRIITNELEDVNRDGVVNEKDVIELLKSGKIGFSLKIDDNKVVPLDFKLAGDNAIPVQKQGDRYVIDFIIREASIMGVLMYHGAHTRKAVELISKYDDKSETTLVGLVNVTRGEFPKLNNVSIEIAKSVENPGSQQQPGVRDKEVLQYSEGNLESALNTISGEIFSFRFQGKRYQEIRQVVENIFRGLSIRNTNEEDSAIAVLFGRLNNDQTDSLSLSELIEIARKDINSLNEREVLKLALFAVALDLELLERNQNELNPSSSIDDLKKNKYLEAAHKLLVALFGENLSDEQRKQRIEEARNVYLINNNNYNSLFKALIGEWGVTEREVVVFKTPLLTFHMDKVLWERLTPEQRMQLILSMNATVSLLRGEVRGENQRKDLLGGEIDTKIGLKVLYENDRVKIAAEGGLVGRLPIPIQDWDGVLANRAELGAYARMYGNIAIIQDKNESLEFVFGAEARLDRILSRDQPARFYMVSNVGVVTRLERVEENGKAYYRYEALAEGNIGVSEGEVRVDGGRIVVRGNIDENRFVGISVGLGGGRGNMLRTIGVMFGMNLEDDNNKQFNINLSYNPEQGRFNFNLGLNVRF